MLYPGDVKNLVLSITNSAGTDPSVSVAPTVSVIQLATGTSVLTGQAMTKITGTQAIYTFPWATTGLAKGDYVAIVSYAADSVTINARLLEFFRLGDTNITGVVALDATTAKDATVARDATVAHQTDLTLLSPDNSQTVLAIKAKTDALPIDPASMTALAALIGNAQELHDYQFGTWTIDKTQSPQILTILSPAQEALASFTLTDSPTATQRAPQSV